MSTTLTDLKVGSTIGGYRVDRREPLENLKGTYYELSHEKTGTRHIHISCPDDNNSFCVVFPTVPKTSNGVPHILEHVSLMGSEKYPVKDPFFAMIPRSLQTFINASTADDHTNFLFSTRNEKDFYNLMSVYLNASFFPLLRETSFKQDGHRLEFDVPEDPDSGLKFKGVVFNEMKGYMATSLFTSKQALGTALYPDLTYAVNAGGDPAAIPDLTYEQLKAFKETHYHPSNSFFITYGNLPLEKTLEQVESQVLSKFDRITTDVEIADQKRFEAPQQYRLGFPISKDEDLSNKATVALGWVTTRSDDSFEILSLKVLNEVLLANAASPLRKALMDSGLGEALADISGLSTDYREAAFAAGLKGANEADAEKIESLILESLETLVKDGVDPTQVDAAIHQLEFQSREISNAQFPYAIRMAYELSAPLTHGVDPYARLEFDKDIERLQTERKNGSFFEDLIRRYFLDNPHRVRVVVYPDPELEAAQLKAETDRLAEIEKGLTEDDKKRLVEEAKVLKGIQEAQQDVSVLPTLELADVPMTFEDVQHTIEDINGAKVGFFPQPTNGITYVDVRSDFSVLTDEQKGLLGVFTYVLSRSGGGSSDYLDMARRIDSYTGGVAAGAAVRTTVEGKTSIRSSATITGKSLARNQDKLIEILGDLIAEAKFDNKRVAELIGQYKAQYDTIVTLAGAQFAILTASAKLSPGERISERLQGLSLYKVLREFAEADSKKIDELIETFNTIRETLFRSGGLEICVTADEKDIPKVREALKSTLGRIPADKLAPTKDDLGEVKLVHEARTAPVPVSYNAKVFPGVSYTHEDAPALLVLSQYLGSKFMTRELREKRGAYGAHSVYRIETGQFLFVTSQDPNVKTTFEVIDQAADYLLDNKLSESDLMEAILSACRQVDPLNSPDSKGRTRFFDDLAGYTLPVKEAFKKRLLEVTEKNLQKVAKLYLKADGAAMASVGNAQKIEEANAELGGIFEVSPV